jgi:O-methyltransferase
MTRTVKVGLARFPYAGNGATQAECPQIADWMVRLAMAIKKDPRCEDSLWKFTNADTPITMVRNQACKMALDHGVDVLLMVDSDQIPDLYLNRDPTAKPFFESSLDFLYRHHGPCVIGSPYCGPEPHPVSGGESNVYVFRWKGNTNDAETLIPALQPYSREEAEAMLGISEVAALPTGLVMIDTRIFRELPPPWFHYEYKDEYETEKASTEDVVFTRNCSLMGFSQYCNWDAWAGHGKPTIVGKPRSLNFESIREHFREALSRSPDRIMEFNAGKSLEEIVGDNGESLRQAGLEPVALRSPGPPEGAYLDATKKDPVPRWETNKDPPLVAGFRADQNQSEESVSFINTSLKEVLRNKIPGVVVEIGCHKGLTSVGLAKILVAEDSAKQLHLYDSFEGISEPCEADKWQGRLPTPGNLACVTDDVVATFREHGMPCANELVIHKGFVADTLPDKLPEKICFALLDVDLYEPTLHSLKTVWPRLESGGVCLLHDYRSEMWPGVKEAWLDFASALDGNFETFPHDECSVLVVKKLGEAFDPLGHFNPEEDTAALRQMAEEHAEALHREGHAVNRTGMSHVQPIAVEIGCWVGATTRMLADIGYQVYAIDHFQGNTSDDLGERAAKYGSEKIKETFLRNMGNRSNVVLVHAESSIAAEKWPYIDTYGGPCFREGTPPIDLLYIDANHDYESVKEDFELWSRFVRPGGLIIGHDFGVFPGVTRFAGEFGASGAGKSLWYITKQEDDHNPADKREAVSVAAPGSDVTP